MSEQTRREPLVPQPKPGVELDWGGHSDVLMEVAQGYSTTFWDFPDWASDYEKINGVWYWT